MRSFQSFTSQFRMKYHDLGLMSMSMFHSFFLISPSLQVPTSPFVIQLSLHRSYHRMFPSALIPSALLRMISIRIKLIFVMFLSRFLHIPIGIRHKLGYITLYWHLFFISMFLLSPHTKHNERVYSSSYLESNVPAYMIMLGYGKAK